MSSAASRFSRITEPVLGVYGPGYAAGLVALLRQSDYSVLSYLKRYWTTQNHARPADRLQAGTPRDRALVLFVSLGALLQVLIGVAVLGYNLLHDTAGALPFGLALIVSYPVVWGHLLAVAYAGYKLIWSVLHAKSVGRSIVCSVLERQVIRLRKKHCFTVIAVVGSVGKTSTKLAVAHTLEPTRRVIYQTGNYNDRVTVPLVLFGQTLPGLLNVPAWLRIFLRNEQTIRRPNFYDIAVLELGTDHPGQIDQFAYLKPEIAIVTAITPEHMEYFGTLDAVAGEELGVADYSQRTVINSDDTPAKYLRNRQVLTYGINSIKADFRATDYNPTGLDGSTVTLHLQHKLAFSSRAAILGEQGVKILLAAAAAGQLAGLDESELQKGLAEVRPFAGRMQILEGIKDSTIIDDTYNASPAPVIAALDVLYGADTPQRIAILGNMNELGEYSQQAHEEVGRYCSKEKLDLVVTIGPDANTFLAPIAKANGCATHTFTSPYEAGKFVRDHLKKGAIVLAEGSQNRVFAEESLKVLLKNTADSKKLVRQSDYWMKLKRAQFGSDT